MDSNNIFMDSQKNLWTHEKLYELKGTKPFFCKDSMDSKKNLTQLSLLLAHNTKHTNTPKEKKSIFETFF